MYRVPLHIGVALIAFIIGISAAGATRSLLKSSLSEVTRLNTYDELKPPDSSSGLSAEQEILDIMKEYGAAQTRLDASFFEKIEAANFVITLRDGNILTKAQVIALMKTWNGNTRFSHEDLHVELFGNSAIVTGWMTARGVGGDAQYSTRWRSIYVFVKRDRGWQIVSTTQVD